MMILYVESIGWDADVYLSTALIWISNVEKNLPYIFKAHFHYGIVYIWSLS